MNLKHWSPISIHIQRFCLMWWKDEGKETIHSFLSSIAPNPFYTPDRRCSTSTAVKEIESHKEESLSAYIQRCTDSLRFRPWLQHLQARSQLAQGCLQPQLPGLGAMLPSPLSLLSTSLCSTGATWQLTYIIPALLSKSNSSVLRNNITLLTKCFIYLQLLGL